MATVHELSNEPVRKIHGKVQIIYSSPFLDEQITPSASTQNRSIDLSEVTDSIEETAYKWFSLFDNKLDGTYHPRPGTYDKGTASVGWWGTILSDGSGNLSPVEYLTLYFDNPRPIFALSVYGDDKADVYPVNFTITCYNQYGTNIYSTAVTNNDSVDWSLQDLNIIDVKSMSLVVSKINKPNHVVRVTEFYNSVRKEYLDDKIRSIDLLEEIHPASGSIPLGEISANEIDVVLDNFDGEFEAGSTGSGIRNFLKKNRKVVAYLGIEDENGDTQWQVLGTFWTTKWNVPRGKTIASFTARDTLELMRFREYKTCALIQANKTLYDAFYDVLLDFGLDFGNFYIDPTLQSIIIPKYWLGRMSFRDALKTLASMANIQVYVTRNDVIKVVQPTPTTNVQQTFAVSTNLYDYSNPSIWDEQVNTVNVNVKQLTLQTSQEILKDETSITLANQEEKTLELFYNTMPINNVNTPTFSGASGISIQEINYYSWGIILTIKNTSGSQQTITSIQATGQPYVIEDVSIITASDTDSVDEHGIISIDVNSNYIQTTSYAQTLATALVTEYKNTRLDIDLENRGDIALILEDKIQVQLEETGEYEDYYVKRQELNYYGALRSRTEGRKI